MPMALMANLTLTAKLLRGLHTYMCVEFIPICRRKAMPLRKAKHADRTYGETDDDDVDLDAVTPSANRRQPRKSQGSQKLASSVVTGGQSDNLSGLLSAAEIADGSSNAPAVKRTLAADRCALLFFDADSLS
jgi:hypothetical protein